MHFFEFGGMVPKQHPKTLGTKYAKLAKDLDIYGSRFQPLPELGHSLPLVTVTGELFKGVPVSIHYSAGVYIGFDTHTTIAPDYTFRLGEDSFFFVKDGKLYRQSARRVTQNKPPILVGIEPPGKDAPAVAETLSDQGCLADDIELLCVPMYDRECGDKIPFNTAFTYTYVNGCGEESQPGYPSNHIEFYDGDAVKLTVDDNPPENAVKRRWYMLVGDSDGVGRWLFIGEQSVGEKTFYNTNCIMSIGEELDTEFDGPPPDCITGVSAVGDNQIVLWSGKHLYFSQRHRPHGFHNKDEYKVLYNIYTLEEVTREIEGQTHHTLLVLTDGLHYIVNVQGDNVDIAEVETHAPAYNGTFVCVADKTIFFGSPRGLYEFNTGGIRLITGQFFTEREWLQYADENTRIAFSNDRLHGVGKECWLMNFSEDDRKDPSFVVTTERAKNVYAHIVGGLVFVMEHGELRKWGEPHETNNRCGVWRSGTMTMAGLWRPVSLKVVSPHYTFISAGAEDALAEFKNFKKKYPHVTADMFVREFPEYKQYYTELCATRVSVEIVVYADGREYYRRKVYTNKPILIPRKFRAIDWEVEVRSKIPIDEIHVQTSKESLLAKG